MSLVAIANMLLDDVFVTRFHADPRVKATELLLQERVPREAILSEVRPAEGAPAAVDAAVPPRRGVFGRRTPAALTRISCRTAATPSRSRTPAAARAAGGACRSRGGARTAPRTRARTSSTSAIRGRVTSGRRPTSPTCREADEYEAVFELDKATFRRRDGDLETQLQVVVSPEDDVEVRRLSITNRGDRPREVEVTSYAEIVLAPPEDDLAHPAFAKLFVETEYDAQSAGLLFSRRPRSAEESQAWAFHVLAIDGRLGGAVEWETDRARFLGRGRSPARPGGARWPCALGNHGRGARSGGRRARARAAGARRLRARHVRDRRRAGSRHRRWRSCASTAMRARRRARSRWPRPTCTSRCSTSA